MAKEKKLSKNFENLKKEIIEILKNNGIKKASIFGSYARGDQTDKSDIDIIIEPYEGMGMEFFGLHIELEEKLGLKVDLLTYDGLNPHFKDYILKNELKII